MKKPVIVLERQTLVAPLGVRFRDVATGEFVGDGLEVTVFPLSNTSRRVRALANHSGAYVLHHAPGLSEFERGAGDEAFWAAPRPALPFVVEVLDRERRFQPARFSLELPARGLTGWPQADSSSPPAPSSSVPLYSSPSRAVVPGMAAVRADLWDTDADAPAAWAVLEAYLDGELLARGVADERGSVALLFPYPAPRAASAASPPLPLFGSPPSQGGVPLVSQAWDMEIRARYSPQMTRHRPLDQFDEGPSPPFLEDTLAQQDAVVWDDAAAGTPLNGAELRYGREVVLKSRGGDASPPAAARPSVLFITPAASPP